MSKGRQKESLRRSYHWGKMRLLQKKKGANKWGEDRPLQKLGEQTRGGQKKLRGRTLTAAPWGGGGGLINFIKKEASLMQVGGKTKVRSFKQNLRQKRRGGKCLHLRVNFREKRWEPLKMEERHLQLAQTRLGRIYTKKKGSSFLCRKKD